MTDKQLELFRRMAAGFTQEALRARFHLPRYFALVGAMLCGKVVFDEEVRRALDHSATAPKEVELNPPPKARA